MNFKYRIKEKLKYHLKETLLTLPGAALMFIMCVVIPIIAAQPKEAEAVESTTVETIQCSTETTVHNPVDNVNNRRSTAQIVEEMTTTAPSYTAEELEILALIIYQEAGGDACCNDTRKKVGSVFLNRVNSKLFPDTFYEVATQHGQYGTLYLTGIQWPARADSIEEIHAVKRSYAIAEELLTYGSVLPYDVIWQAGFEQGYGVYAYQDGVYFCY